MPSKTPEPIPPYPQLPDYESATPSKTQAMPANPKKQIIWVCSRELSVLHDLLPLKKLRYLYIFRHS